MGIICEQKGQRIHQDEDMAENDQNLKENLKETKTETAKLGKMK